jgi:penicillin-binding protein 1A
LALAGIVLILAYPQLPSLEVLTDYQPKIPLRIYTADGHLIGEFGEERRARWHQGCAAVMKQAILAAEDERFYQHPGIDTHGRAARSLLQLRQRRQAPGRQHHHHAGGAQFLPVQRKTLTRKLYEALLAFKIENNLSKDEILEIYINQIYLGQRAYGFAAAAQIYFGKSLKTSASPKPPCWPACPRPLPATTRWPTRSAPSSASCTSCAACTNSASSTSADEAEAQAQVLHVKRDVNDVRRACRLCRRDGPPDRRRTFPGGGLHPRPSRHHHHRKADQEAAYASLRRGVIDYDRRHGYRGAEGYADLKAVSSDQDEALEERCRTTTPAICMPPWYSKRAQAGEGLSARRRKCSGLGDGLKFAAAHARRQGARQQAAASRRRHHVQKDDKGHWQIVQLPEVEAAFVAASPTDGSPSAPWSAVSISTATSSTMSPRPGASPAPASSPSSTRPRWRRASHRPAVIQDEPI